MHLSKHQLAILALIANTVIWSAASPILKWSLGDTPPFALAFFRFFLATLIMVPFIINQWKIKSGDIPKIFALSFVGITAHIIFYYLGLALAPSINVPIISSTTPIFLILCGVFFLKERPKRKTIIGTLISLIGAMVIIIRPLLENASFGPVLGNLYFVLATVTIVIFTVLLKKFNLKYSYMTLIFWMFLFSTLVLFPMFLVEQQTTSVLHFDLKSIIGILYGAIFSSTLGYFFYTYGAKHIKANEIGIFSYLEPFATALVAIPLLHETITFTYLLGAMFVFAGIFIAEGKIHYHPFHHLKKHPETETLVPPTISHP